MGKNEFQAGYARADVTPTMSVPLSGYSNSDQRMSRGTLEPLYATCVAFTDGAGESVLIYTVDHEEILTQWLGEMRRAVQTATGVPADHILFAATHTHSGPDQASELPVMKEYLAIYWKKLAEAGTAAMADRAPATLLLGKTRTHGINFVRHYRLADGTVAGDNFGSYKAGVVGHVVPADEQVQIAKLVRAGKKDILLFNWQVHPKLASTASTPYGREHRPLASSDFIGDCRDYVEEKTGCLFAYFSGASGNLNPLSKIESENPPSLEPQAYGRMVGEEFLAGLASLVPAKLGEIKIRQMQFKAQYDHTEDDKVRYAEEVVKVWRETNKFSLTREVGDPHGVIGAYHAEAILRRAGYGKEREMELDALTVGDLAFVTAPYEMFCTNGQFVKENSPYPATFVLSCSNGNNAYIADALAFTYNSYEVCNRDFVQGTAEGLASAMVDMLRELHGQ